MTRGRWILAALICAVAVAGWLVVREGSGDLAEGTPGEPFSLPGDPAEEMLWDWYPEFRQTPFLPSQILFDPREVVVLLNQRAGLPHACVLWQPGAPVPAGYQVNPHPKDWSAYDRELDEARASPAWWQFEEPHYIGAWQTPLPAGFAPPQELPAPRRNTLYEQTGLYLWLYRYRTHLVDGRIYVFREDALIPPLFSRKLYFRDPSEAAYYESTLGPAATLPRGRFDLRPLLESHVQFLPGMSAALDSRSGTIALCFDRDGMYAALRFLDARYGHGGGSPMVDSQLARWKWKVSEGTHKAKEYLETRFDP